MGSEKFVHRPGGVLVHVLEDVSVPSEGHRRVGVAKHPGDRVEWDALPQGQSTSGVSQVVEANIYGRAGLLEESPERITESRLRILPFVFGKTRPGSAQEVAAILSSSCLARCVLRTSTVRGPMCILRSLPVLVVETRVLVRVSAERLTVM